MTVDFEVRDRIAIITLNRPEARNAVSQQLAEDLEAAIDRLEADEDLWIGILCGNGPAFCAGADLKAIASGEARLTTRRGGFAGLVRRTRTKPLIAAVEGPPWPVEPRSSCPATWWSPVPRHASGCPR